MIIGGGDTGADCLGTAHRQGAASVTQLDYNPQPPELPRRRHLAVADLAVGAADLARACRGRCPALRGRGAALLGDSEGRLRALEIAEVRAVRDPDGRRIITPVGASMEIPCDLALLAIGFEGAERMTLLDELGITLQPPRVITCGSDWQTSAPGVFVCGDAHRGASLVVWAIAEGRAAAHPWTPT